MLCRVLPHKIKEPADLELLQVLKTQKDALNPSMYEFIVFLHVSRLHIFSRLDAICASVFYLIQSLLPNGKQRILTDLSNKKRKTQKNFSTKESRDSFIMVCETEALYKENYDAKVARESSVPPYITIIGSLLEPKTILCDFENIMYKMHSLPKAIDICFKAYHLFSMEYAPAARLMWQFINKYFYQLKDASPCPAVHMLIKAIKGNSSALISIFFHCNSHTIFILQNRCPGSR